MTAVTFLTNVQYTVFTLASKPNLDIANHSKHYNSTHQSKTFLRIGWLQSHPNFVLFNEAAGIQ
jgi:D-ribose pyranose/furanose isomerase RbsD